MRRTILIGLWCSAIVVAGIGASRLALSQSPKDTVFTVNLTEVVQRLRGQQGNRKLSVQQKAQMQTVRAEMMQLMRSQPLQLLKLVVRSPETAKQLFADVASEAPLTLEQEFEGIKLAPQSKSQICQARSTLSTEIDRQVRERPSLALWLVALPQDQAAKLYEETLAKPVKAYVDRVSRLLSFEQQQRWRQNWQQILAARTRVPNVDRS
ncbi:hypothetical protein ACQ4M3_39395 [Leptolyngbya sp. AN03gr2]|uniref:hypothetical protein n=1 Tax=unclassified Leptolyngbya TaxID=2650499 RepID=UPI003D30FD00